MSNYNYIENKPSKLYTDLNLAFSKNPVNKDVTVKRNEEAIKQSLRNLILLGKKEKPFHPEIGGGAYDLLFENFDEVGTADILQIKIAGIIQRFEPRVDLERVDIDFLNDNNSVSITIYYTILTTLVQSSVQLFLKIAR
jgi:phage baseplate assembly protein W